jgi:hypothetical protein
VIFIQSRDRDCVDFDTPSCHAMLSHTCWSRQGFGEDNPLAVHIGLAYHYGLEMRAYEGGPDTSGPNLGKDYLVTKGQANVDPRIKDRIVTYLTNW